MKKLKIGTKVVMPSGRVAKIEKIKGNEFELVYEGSEEKVSMTWMNLYRAYCATQRAA